MRKRAAHSRILRLLGLSFSLTGALGCNAPVPDDETTPDSATDCSTGAINERLFHLMKDAYLWYDKVPDVDYASYNTPDALLSALLYKDVDKWSYISPKETNDAYYGEGLRVGLGVRMHYDIDDTVRLSLVYDGSPAADAALARGDRILSINAKTIAEIEDGGLWSTILGPDEEGISVELTIERQGGEVFDVTLVKRSFKIITTPIYKTLVQDDKTIGYLVFDRFLGTSVDELDNVFASFKKAGVTDLILDLRYNGGGLINVAGRLASLIGGENTSGKTFSHIVYNDKHSDWNKDLQFEAADPSLNLTRVFIIATQSTASSSELLINGLRPHIDVKVIGDTTYGKPVGMAAFNDCDLVIHPISFRMTNANDEGDFYDGLAPDCASADDLSRALGDEAETSLAEALYVLRYGSCSQKTPLVRFPPSGARRISPSTQSHEIGAVAWPIW